ncbi:MAG: hypothetical protein KJ621_07095 [Proteobacteria bacterium]|nr:hypothetical protein [Pseudomonadota bacterium]MBU1742438.1 hypothetical protein [Pseudomonadota bacterium]
MRITLGIVCLAFGTFGWLGQMVSAVNFPLAQKLGLQEKGDHTDEIFQRAEQNTARWDFFVLWTLILAGILMLINNHWWPYVSLIAGGIYLDTAGREAAKFLSLKQSNVRIGSSKDLKIAAFFFSLMALIALWVLVYTLWFLAARPNPA